MGNTLRHSVRGARNDDARVAMTDEHDVHEVLVVEAVHDIHDVRREVDFRAREMDSLAEAGQRRCKDVVALRH